MTRSKKRILSIMLTVVLVFCTMFALQSAASAAINWTIQGTGTSSNVTRSFGGGTFTANLSKTASTATAVSSHTTTIYLGARAKAVYVVPASPNFFTTIGEKVENASTRVEAKVSIASAYTIKTAYARHGSIYNTSELVVETKN